jgi:hypothetical protein
MVKFDNQRAALHLAEKRATLAAATAAAAAARLHYTAALDTMEAANKPLTLAKRLRDAAEAAMGDSVVFSLNVGNWDTLEAVHQGAGKAASAANKSLLEALQDAYHAREAVDAAEAKEELIQVEEAEVSRLLEKRRGAAEAYSARAAAVQKQLAALVDERQRTDALECQIYDRVPESKRLRNAV